MYTHIYIYVCMYIYVCIYIWYLRVDPKQRKYMHVYVCKYMYACICMHVYVCMYMYDGLGTTTQLLSWWAGNYNPAFKPPTGGRWFARTTCPRLARAAGLETTTQLLRWWAGNYNPAFALMGWTLQPHIGADGLETTTLCLGSTRRYHINIMSSSRLV